MTLCFKCHHRFHKAAGGHVRPAYGPFFPDPASEDWARARAADLGDEVKETLEVYDACAWMITQASAGREQII
jgi:hypothetical protein